MIECRIRSDYIQDHQHIDDKDTVTQRIRYPL